MTRFLALLGVTGGLLATCMVLLEFVPSWARPAWLVPILLASLVAFGGSLFTVVAWTRAHPDWAARSSGPSAGEFALMPRSGAIMVAAVIYIGVLGALAFVGSDMLAARALGADPGRATVVTAQNRDCRNCSPIVTFQVGGQTYRAILGDDSAGDAHAGTALVYDPDDPYRVMALADWQSGRGAVEQYVLVGTGVVAVVTGLGLWELSARRRLRFATLHPDAAIRSLQQVTSGRSRSQVWRVEFTDGAQARYVDSAPLRAALHDRIGTAVGVVDISPGDRLALAPADLPSRAELPSPAAGASGAELPSAVAAAAVASSAAVAPAAVAAAAVASSSQRRWHRAVLLGAAITAVLMLIVTIVSWPSKPAARWQSLPDPAELILSDGSHTGPVLGQGGGKGSGSVHLTAAATDVIQIRVFCTGDGYLSMTVDGTTSRAECFIDESPIAYGVTSNLPTDVGGAMKVQTSNSVTWRIIVTAAS